MRSCLCGNMAAFFYGRKQTGRASFRVLPAALPPNMGPHVSMPATVRVLHVQNEPRLLLLIRQKQPHARNAGTSGKKRRIASSPCMPFMNVLRAGQIFPLINAGAAAPRRTGHARNGHAHAFLCSKVREQGNGGTMPRQTRQKTRSCGAYTTTPAHACMTTPSLKYAAARSRAGPRDCVMLQQQVVPRQSVRMTPEKNMPAGNIAFARTAESSGRSADAGCESVP